MVEFSFSNQSAPSVVSGSYIVPLNVISWSDTLVSFRMPPGQGYPTTVVYIPGAQNTTTVSFVGVQYAQPSVIDVLNANVTTTAGYISQANLLMVYGTNFGPNSPGDYNQVSFVSLWYRVV